MSINACTIDSFTLDSFCSRQRSVVFGRLVPILHPPIPTGVGGGNPRVLRDTFTRPDYDVEDKPVLTFEQPIVAVTVELFGHTGTDTQDVTGANVDFVSVTDLAVAKPSVTEATIVISITDLYFE